MRPVRRARRRLLSVFGSLLIVAGLLPVAAVAPVAAAGTIVLSALGAAYTQDFNTLAVTGTANTDLPVGWDLIESGGGARDNEAYAANDGGSNTGDIYSYGTGLTAERAFGGLRSGTLIPTIGASFTNATGATVTALSISYAGEQWRLGTAARGPDRIDFQYSLDALRLTSGTWVDSDGLDFSSPITAVVGAKDGNAAENRIVVSATVGGLTIPDGSIFWIRWSDFDPSGADDGLAVDDFSLTPLQQDAAPFVSSTTPPNGATGVAVSSNVTITFSEAVNVTGTWYSISCASSGAHTAVADAGPTVFTLNPDADFANSELCTVTVFGDQVTDQDTDDPPDDLAGDPSWSFTTESPPTPPTPIHDIQGATHTSPMLGPVSNVNGIVTAKRSNGFYMQDPNPDANDATSEAILVFTSAAPTSVSVGDAVKVAGSVIEFRPGATGLAITEITGPTISVLSSGNPLPAPTIIGTGGRVPPATVIDDDSSGFVETTGVFDPAADGIDFYETLEAMRVQVNNPVVVGPRNGFGEIFVLADDGAGAATRTARGGIVIRDLGPDAPGDYASGDFNPERIQLDDVLLLLLGGSTPNASVGDHFTSPAVGILDYDFGNFEVNLTSALTTVPGGAVRESTAVPGSNELSVATFNVENLDANEPQSKFDALALQIVNNMRSPDVVSLEEIQDNNGAVGGVGDPTTDASETLTRLIDAITTAGGPPYQYRQIDPVAHQDGGEPGGNIRVGFIFRTDRGLAFVDRPGGGSTTPTAIVTGPDGKPQLSFSPGRVDPTNTAWNASRKPLAGEFTFRGETFFLITNHFNSKGGDNPLFGRTQPPARGTEVQRHQQAQVVNNFVDAILAVDPNANVIVLGDINDFEFSQTMALLEGGVLQALMGTLPQNERYSYVFEGNSQSLDHIVVSNSLLGAPFAYDAVHANAEFFDQLSDHDPQVARFVVNSAPTLSAGGPYTVAEGSSVVLTATASDPEGDALTYAWDLDNNGTFETSGQSVTFSAATIDGPASRTVQVRASDGTASTVASATVTITNVAPTATFNAPASTFAGFPFTISLTNPSDPSTADTAAGFTYAFDCGDGAGYGAFSATSSRSCPTSDTGTRTVRGTIRDEDLGATEYTATVSVEVTYTSLCELGRTVVTPTAAANLLCTTLRAAAGADARGNERAKEALLRVYRLEVDVLRRLGRVSSTNAELLKRLSTRL